MEMIRIKGMGQLWVFGSFPYCTFEGFINDTELWNIFLLYCTLLYSAHLLYTMEQTSLLHSLC